MSALSLRRSVVPAWLLGWIGAAVLGVVNGVVRDTTYGRRVSKLAAHQISTVTLVAALACYMRAFGRRWPLQSGRDAGQVGGVWALLTLAFEFGLGTARGLSWREMTADYDLRKGRLWILVPSFLAVGPACVRRLDQRSSGRRA